MTYWLREEGTDPALIDEAKRLGTELEGLAPIVLSGLPLTNKEDDAVLGVLSAVARGGNAKKGGAVRQCIPIAERPVAKRINFGVVGCCCAGHLGGSTHCWLVQRATS